MAAEINVDKLLNKMKVKSLVSQSKHCSVWSISEESGYSSDTSSVSTRSQRIRELRHSSSDETFSSLLTPELKWKNRLRISSTPYPSSETKQLLSPEIDPIMGPLLRMSNAHSVITTENSSDNMVNKLTSSESPKMSDVNKNESSKCVKLKFKEIGRKTLFKFRSPLKSPEQNKLKSEDESEIKHHRYTKFVKDKSVKKLFTDASSSGKFDRSTSSEDKPDQSQNKSNHANYSIIPKNNKHEMYSSRLSIQNDSGYEDESSRSILAEEEAGKIGPLDSSCTKEKLNAVNMKLDEVIVNRENKEKAVKQLFIDKIETPLRRVSPRLSNIVHRVINESPYLLPKIFSFLSSEDLVCVSQVNRCFRQVVLKTHSLNLKIELYFEEIRVRREKIGKENIKVKGIENNNSSNFAVSSPRKQLQQLQNTTESPKKIVHTPSISLFDKFVREGKKLVPGEIQMKCVQCHNPARVIQSEYKAMCSKTSCGYIYCTRCSMPYHAKPSDCPSTKPRPKVTSATKILTKACKKRLRRL